MCGFHNYFSNPLKSKSLKVLYFLRTGVQRSGDSIDGLCLLYLRKHVTIRKMPGPVREAQVQSLS